MAHLWLPCWSWGTRDSASHEGTGHLAQRHKSDALCFHAPWVSWSKHSGLRTTEQARASICSFSSLVSSSSETCPGQRWLVDFSSYSFLRLRWRDKVLGGKPNSRLQGCHILTLTETNPKTEEGGGEGETKDLRVEKLQSLGSNIV